MMNKMSIVMVAACLATSTVANATVTLAGLSFDDNAFVDEILEVHGNWSGPVTSVIGPNISTWTWNPDYDESAYIKVAFTNNWIVNGPGADFVLFEASGTSPGCPAEITINGITKMYDTPLREGMVNAAIIDLDDFSVAPAGQVSMITLWGGHDTDYMAIGALNNGCPIPAPGALLIGTVGAGLVSWLRRRKTI